MKADVLKKLGVRRDERKAGGFSLIELLVVLAIIGIVAAVVIANYRDFDSTTLLRSLAYDIALSIREAQVLGVGVRGTNGNFDVPHGVHFDLDTPTQYILFRDADDDYEYDSNEAVSTFTIGNGNFISALCLDDGEGGCVEEDASAVGVLFRRPELNAIFAVGGVEQPSAGSLSVTVTSRSNNTQTVRVGSTGQISVNPTDSLPGGEGEGEETYSWQDTGVDQCDWWNNHDPIVTPGDACSVESAVGYVEEADICIFAGLWPYDGHSVYECLED